jgi:putative addiction module component (TIGR02574 family)
VSRQRTSIKSLGIVRLPVEERLILVEKIWDSIAAESAAAQLTDTQRIELQKRIEEDDANPDDVTPWEQVKPSTLARLRNDAAECFMQGASKRLA